MTYRIWLLKTYGNSGSAILVTAKSEIEVKEKAIKLGYIESQISKVELLGS